MKFRDLLILAGGVAAVAQASALSLGNTQDPLHLGAPVNLVFPVQADAGLTPESSCITAEVWMGDFALPNSQITLAPLSQAVQVRTSAPVSEPLVTVKLQAGCTGSTTRSYTFFADPPTSMAASIEPIDLSKIQVSTIPVAATTASAQTAPKKPRPAKRAATPPAKEPQPTAGTPSTNSELPKTEEAIPPELVAPTEHLTTLPQNDAAQSRLRLEPIEGLDIATVDAPVNATTAENTASPQTARSAVIDPSTQLILDSNAARLESMEKQFQALQTQLLNNRSEITGLQSQLVQAQNQELPMWVNIMLALLAVALATIAWLLQRIKQERQRAQSTWADTVLAANNSSQATTIDTRAQNLQVNALPTESEPLTQVVTTTPLARSATSDSAPLPTWNSAETQTPTLMPDELYAEFEQLSNSKLHNNSIDEVLTAQALFDVQEQAEFYASIGENDQAIEILQTHIEQHASSSPLAYIELLQLLYRLSRTEAFEQVRNQFQAHFNVNVPEFLGFSRKGQDLWTGHPDVLGKIEALWPTDNVQALLRNLIVRPSPAPHTTTAVRFDMSAFDDLLMLYNVAQTTPASSRGQLPGRVRTAPTEVPLPELFTEQEESPVVSSSFTSSISTGTATASLPLHSASLDLLNTISTPAPLAPEQPLGDSPFQGPAHRAPNAALVDGLSLDWTLPSTAELPPPPTAPAPNDTTGASPEVPDLLSAELAVFTMDDRDLPPPTQR